MLILHRFRGFYDSLRPTSTPNIVQFPELQDSRILHSLQSAAWPRELKRRFYGNCVIMIASLNKALYDDYLCLVASNKQQIKW